MKKLVALAAIAAAAFAADSPAISQGQTFEVPDDQADELIKNGLAEEKAAEQPKAKKKLVKAAVLSDCAYGEHGDVVEVDPDIAKTTVQLDPAPAAVAYFEAQLKAKKEAAAKKDDNAQIQA
jgi:hypothetical protein